MLRVMGTGPGPTTLAAAGAAWASLSRRPAPTAPVPMPMPPRNPRRETAFLGLGSLVEFTRHLPFRALMLNMVLELESIYQKGWGGGDGVYLWGALDIRVHGREAPIRAATGCACLPRSQPTLPQKVRRNWL